MGKIGKFVLTVTAFAPIMLVYALVSFTYGEFWCGGLWIALSIALALICWAVITWVKRTLEAIPYVPCSVENTDGDTLNLLLMYLVPLITRDLYTYNWSIWIVVSVLFFGLVALGFGHQYNPVLTIFCYHYYRVKSKSNVTQILITKRRIYNSGEQISVGELSDFLLIEKD